jgi:glycosyltransferase involved in cell wall biosynthesis
MRLAIIGPTHPFRGGIAHHTTLLVRHLREAGDDVLFISFTRQYPRWLYGRDDKDPSQHPLTAETEYLLDTLNPLSWWRTVRRVAEWQPEMVLLPWWVPFFAPVWAYLGWGIKRLRPAPKLIFLCHNVLPHEPSWLDVPAVRLALGRGDGFVVHAQEQAVALRHIWPSARVLVTPLPTYADVGQTAVPLPIPPPEGCPVLLFCGFVRPYKGLDVLLEALPQVLAQQTVHLMVVGEFWQGTAEYEAQIGRLGIAPHVTLINQYVADEVLAAYVRRANVVVLPYRSATQSAVVQMAFGLGTPVITTNVGGLAEAVEDGVTGLVVGAEDVGELAGAVNRYVGEGLEVGLRQHIHHHETPRSWETFTRRLADFIAALAHQIEYAK